MSPGVAVGWYYCTVGAEAECNSAAPSHGSKAENGVPAFRLNGKFLVAYAASKNHCAFYPGAVIQALKETEKYDTSKGTIRFSPDKPLPAALVRKLVKLRIARMRD